MGDAGYIVEVVHVVDAGWAVDIVQVVEIVDDAHSADIV